MVQLPFPLHSASSLKNINVHRERPFQRSEAAQTFRGGLGVQSEAAAPPPHPGQNWAGDGPGVHWAISCC